jgi:hypothetical protein
MRRTDDQWWISRWKQAIAMGTAMCRACGDPAKKMKPRGLCPGCYCRTCYSEITRGTTPKVTNPNEWKKIRRRG